MGAGLRGGTRAADTAAPAGRQATGRGGPDAAGARAETPGGPRAQLCRTRAGMAGAGRTAGAWAGQPGARVSRSGLPAHTGRLTAAARRRKTGPQGTRGADVAPNVAAWRGAAARNRGRGVRRGTAGHGGTPVAGRPQGKTTRYNSPACVGFRASAEYARPLRV